MFAVITLHIAANNWYTDDVHTFAWNTFNFYDSIVRWGVPVFTMISGALFLSPTKQITLKKLYLKNILRIVLTFIAWSSFYAFVGFLQGNSIKGCLASVLSGHYHMWFLFMLVGLYIIVPLLRKITENATTEKYFLLISFIFTFLIPAFFIGLRCVDKIFDKSLYDFANNIYSKVNFHFAIGYSSYFVLGHYLSVTEIGPKTEKICYMLGVLGFLSTIFLTMGISYFQNKPDGTFYGNMTVNVLLESLSVFVFCKNRLTRFLQKERVQKVVGKLSQLSFGVYLIHAFFIELLQHYGIHTLCFNPILSVPCIAVLVILLSLTVSAILHKIPIVNKYLV